MTYIENYLLFFSNLTNTNTKEEYREFFDENSYFEDPFHKVVGVDTIYKIFENMYQKLHNPRFEIIEHISNENTSYIKWNFYYQIAYDSEIFSFVGVSRVVFNHYGIVKEHIDFWDAGNNIYEKIPILGFIIRLIKRKLNS